MKIERMFVVIVTLQVLVLASLWTGQQLPAARAAVLPDPGAQREREIDELSKLNDKMDKLIDLLSSGKLQVAVGKTDSK